MTDLNAPMSPDEVRAARCGLGLTQQGLADFLGLEGRYAKDTVRAWEKPGGNPISGPAKVAIRLALKFVDSGHAAEIGVPGFAEGASHAA